MRGGVQGRHHPRHHPGVRGVQPPILTPSVLSPCRNCGAKRALIKAHSQLPIKLSQCYSLTPSVLSPCRNCGAKRGLIKTHSQLPIKLSQCYSLTPSVLSPCRNCGAKSRDPINLRTDDVTYRTGPAATCKNPRVAALLIVASHTIMVRADYPRSRPSGPVRTQPPSEASR